MKNTISIFLILTFSLFAFGGGVTVSQAQEQGDFILILNKSGDTAWQLDASTGERIAVYKTGNAPHEVAISPDQTRAAITNYGDQSPGSTLTLVDLVNREVIKTIDLSPYQRPHGIQWFADRQRLIVSVEAQQAVAIVNVSEGTVSTTIKTNERGSHMVELSRHEERVYTTNLGDGSITVLDLVKRTKITTIPTDSGSEGITLNADGSEIWVTNRAANSITVIDSESLEITATLESSDFPIRAEVSPDGRYLAVSNARSSDVTVFDAESKKQVAKLSTLPESQENGTPIGLIFSHDNARLYVANSEADHIVVIDTGSWSILDRYPTGDTPDGIGYFRIQ